MDKTPGASRSSSLTTVLVRRILQGVYAPHTRLPTEREMAEEFEVSRHVVREALKRLEALGLLRIQHGSGAYAKDPIATGGIEIFDYLLFDDQGRLDAAVLEDFFVFWTHIFREVVRLAALKRSEEDLGDLKRTLAERTEAAGDLERLNTVGQNMFQTVGRATHNSVYQLVFNNVGRAIARIGAKTPLHQLAPLAPQERLVRLLEAIENRDAEMAALIVEREMETVREKVLAFLGNVANGAGGSES